MIPDLLLVAVDFYKDPRQFPHLREGTGPLPPGITELLDGASALLAEGRREDVSASLGVSPEELEAALRFFVKEVMLRAGDHPARILGVPADADLALIKKHYRHLMSLFHPDKDTAGEGWDALYAPKITEAYSMLRKQAGRAGEPQAPAQSTAEPDHPRWGADTAAPSSPSPAEGASQVPNSLQPQAIFADTPEPPMMARLMRLGLMRLVNLPRQGIYTGVGALVLLVVMGLWMVQTPAPELTLAGGAPNAPTTTGTVKLDVAERGAMGSGAVAMQSGNAMAAATTKPLTGDALKARVEERVLAAAATEATLSADQPAKDSRLRAAAAALAATSTPSMTPEPAPAPEPVQVAAVEVTPEPVIEPAPVAVLASAEPEPIEEPASVAALASAEPDPMPAAEPIPEPVPVVQPQPVEDPALVVAVAALETPTPEPELAPVVEPEPIEEPAPVAALASAEPDPMPAPEPIPEPVPVVEAAPIAVAVVATPAPAVDPEPMAAPTPVAEPEPIPEPTPVAEPALVVAVTVVETPPPEPKPAPVIEPEPIEEPEPVIAVADVMVAEEPAPALEPDPIPEPEPVVAVATVEPASVGEPSSMVESGPLDDPAFKIQELVARIEQAYEQEDAKAFAALFTDEGDATDVTGREAIYAYYEEYFSRTNIDRFRLVFMTWEAQGEGVFAIDSNVEIWIRPKDDRPEVRTKVPITWTVTALEQSYFVDRMEY